LHAVQNTEDELQKQEIKKKSVLNMKKFRAVATTVKIGNRLQKVTNTEMIVENSTVRASQLDEDTIELPSVERIMVMGFEIIFFFPKFYRTFAIFSIF